MATQYSLGTGLGNLFAALSNGKAVRDAAYNEQTRQNLQDAFLKGKVGDQQAQEDAYAAMPQDLEAMGVDPGQGKAYTDVARATGSKANALGQLFNIMKNQAYIKGAQDAMNKGNTLGMNFGLTAGDRKPLEMTKIEGDTAVNPNVTPDGQTLPMTPFGQADLAQRALEATQKLNRTSSKVIPLSSTGMKVFALPPSDNDPLSTGLDTGRFAHFQEWAEDKGFRDLNAALPRFLQEEQRVRDHLQQVLQEAHQHLQAAHPADRVGMRARIRTRLEHLGVSDKDLDNAAL